MKPGFSKVFYMFSTFYFYTTNAKHVDLRLKQKKIVFTLKSKPSERCNTHGSFLEVLFFEIFLEWSIWSPIQLSDRL